MSRKAQQRPLLHGPTKEEWERVHEAMKADKEIWSSLAVDGFQSDGHGGIVENRRCPTCQSSIGRYTTALQAVEVLSVLGAVHARSLEAVVDAGAQAQGRKPADRVLPGATRSRS